MWLVLHDEKFLRLTQFKVLWMNLFYSISSKGEKELIAHLISYRIDIISFFQESTLNGLAK
jgi:hypothetical protein